MFWNAAPALVEGNTIVIKPSEDAPMSTQAAVQIYAEAGIPHGVINLVHGDGVAGLQLVCDHHDPFGGQPADGRERSREPLCVVELPQPGTIRRPSVGHRPVLGHAHRA